MQSEGRANRRWLRVLTVGVGVLVLFGGGWTVAVAVQSPAQREAAATAPQPKPVTAEVTRGDLSRSITAEVGVRRQDRQTLRIASTDDLAVVTKRPIGVGGEIRAGRPVAEVNGRPVLALPGAFAFYRDLTQGDTGPDVKQLQAGLSAAGFPVMADGSFGAATARAVHELYGAVGYAVSYGEGTPISETAPDSDAETEPDTSVHSQRPVMVPRTELTVMATSSAYAVRVPSLGAVVTDDTSVEVERGAMVAVASIPSDVGIQIAPGMRGTVKVGSSTTPVKVVTVSAGREDTETRVELIGTSGGLHASSRTPPPLLHLEIDVVERDSLLVPSIAVISGGSGVSHVQRQNPDGSFTRVPVSESGQLGGQSAITISGSEQLGAGDRVKVG